MRFIQSMWIPGFLLVVLRSFSFYVGGEPFLSVSREPLLSETRPDLIGEMPDSYNLEEFVI